MRKLVLIIICLFSLLSAPMASANKTIEVRSNGIFTEIRITEFGHSNVYRVILNDKWQTIN